MHNIWLEILWVFGGSVVFGILMLWSMAYAIGGVAATVAACGTNDREGEIIDVQAREIGKEHP